MALIQQSTAVRFKVLDRYVSVALDQVVLNIKADTAATFPPNHAAANFSLVQEDSSKRLHLTSNLSQN